MSEKHYARAKYAKHPPEQLAIPLYLLQALRDCNRSTIVGMVDRGSPRRLQELSIHKLVIARDGGYVTTDLGREYLASHKRELMKL